VDFAQVLKSQPGGDIGILLEGLPPNQLEPIRTERTPRGHLLPAYRVTR
jgi:hypothetical protein